MAAREMAVYPDEGGIAGHRDKVSIKHIIALKFLTKARARDSNSYSCPCRNGWGTICTLSSCGWVSVKNVSSSQRAYNSEHAYRMQGDAVVNRMNNPEFKKTATTAPQSCVWA
jgi:hypothetical protein